MPLIGFNHLYQFADGLRSALSVVVAGGADPTVLEAMSLAQRRGWVEPILTGNVHDTQRLADDLNIDLSGFCLIESDEPAVAAVAAVKTGRAQMLMKGQIATRLLMKAVLARDTGLRRQIDLSGGDDGNPARQEVFSVVGHGNHNSTLTGTEGGYPSKSNRSGDLTS